MEAEKVKHEVIKNPKLIGCLNCSPIPSVKLPKNTLLAVGFGEISLTIDGEEVWYTVDGDERKTVRWLEKKFKEQLQKADCALLFFNQPLHDETYKYDKESGEWYLVKQGKGFA
jgi:hypothetical protein